MMRTIIAGSRTIHEYPILEKAIKECGFNITLVLCGCANGADKLGDDWAQESNIPVEYYPADWNKFGRKAGFLRNVEMINRAEALIALWDGKSRGTKHTISLARKKGIRVHIEIVG